MADRATLVFTTASVAHYADATVTSLPRGGEVVAAPEDNDAYRATAERLGYGADTLRMMRDHETLHSALAHILGLPESPTLRRVADRLGADDLTDAEEDAVLAIQRFANAAGADLGAALARLAAAPEPAAPLTRGPPHRRRELPPRDR